jgi:hypothetical protein
MRPRSVRGAAVAGVKSARTARHGALLYARPCLTSCLPLVLPFASESESATKPRETKVASAHPFAIAPALRGKQTTYTEI